MCLYVCLCLCVCVTSNEKKILGELLLSIDSINLIDGRLAAEDIGPVEFDSDCQ